MPVYVLTSYVGSGLTRKQRALVIVVILLMVYIAFGAMCNTFIMGLHYVDALYFTTVSIETIGFGDIPPSSTGARVFICCYSALGIVNLGMAVALIRETILEGLEVNYRKRLKRMRRRRREGRRYRRWEARWKRAVKWRLQDMGEAVWVPDNHRDDSTSSVRFRGLSAVPHTEQPLWYKRFLSIFGWESDHLRHRLVWGHPRGKQLNIDALDDAQLEAAALEAGVPLDMFVERRERPKPSESEPPPPPSVGLRHSATQHSMATDWPQDTHTPTHAQVGRMAVVVTKFGVATVGRFAHASAHHHAGHSENHASEGAPDEQQGADGGNGVLNHTPTWAQELAEEQNRPPPISFDNVKDAMESEEKKVYYIKVSQKCTISSFPLLIHVYSSPSHGVFS